MKYREVRRISAEDLQRLCIEKRWYTCGSGKEYMHLLCDLADDKENITTDDIVEIAKDIMEHSCMTDGEEITSVCFEVARVAVTFFEEVG